MTPDLIERMDKAAKEATPGPWDFIQGNLVRAIKGDLAIPIFRSEAPVDWFKNKRLTNKVMCAAYAAEWHNANFMATCNPDAVSQLIDHARAQQAEIETLRAALREINPCERCEGEGWILASVPMCCGKGTRSGECCGNAVEGQEQQDCPDCSGHGHNF